MKKYKYKISVEGVMEFSQTGNVKQDTEILKAVLKNCFSLNGSLLFQGPTINVEAAPESTLEVVKGGKVN